MRADVVLSSGFLAFARHAGFLSAVEERGLQVEAVCGTSSGAVAGALWAAGMKGGQIAELFARTSMMPLGRPSATFWRGPLSMNAFVTFLRAHLPARFEDLPRPFAVGVVDGRHTHRLLTSGPLPEAVAASCAMPWIFTPVLVDGTAYADGGAADRLGIAAWRQWRPQAQSVVAHWVERTAGRDVETSVDGLVIVRTPRSGARFWSLGDVMGQTKEAQEIAMRTLSVGNGGAEP